MGIKHYFDFKKTVIKIFNWNFLFKDESIIIWMTYFAFFLSIVLHIIAYCFSILIDSILSLFKSRIIHFNNFRLKAYLNIFYIICALTFIKFSSADGLKSIYQTFKIIEENFTEYLLLLFMLFLFSFLLSVKRCGLMCMKTWTLGKNLKKKQFMISE